MGLGLWLFVGLREMEALDLGLVWVCGGSDLFVGLREMARRWKAVICLWVCRFEGDGSVRDGENHRRCVQPNPTNPPAHTRSVLPEYPTICCFYCSLRVGIVQT
jgi:hypothetical protein